MSRPRRAYGRWSRCGDVVWRLLILAAVHAGGDESTRLWTVAASSIELASKVVAVLFAGGLLWATATLGELPRQQAGPRRAAGISPD
jgi:hypothetical protein